MPLKFTTKAQNPNFIPFIDWYQTKIQEFTQANDQANLTKFQSAMQAKEAAALAENWSARDFQIGAVESEGLTHVCDTPGPRIPEFDEIYTMWTTLYNVEIVIEDI